MQRIIDSIYEALEKGNFYAALFVSLTLPDICSALEFGKTSGSKYSNWFEHNLAQYKGYLSGDDCYALRCALLHQGKNNITDQCMRKILEHCIFLTEGSHRNLIKDIVINGTKESFLELNVQEFCKDICDAVQKWLITVSSNKGIQDRLRDTIEIHKPGYIYKGIFSFE